MRHALQASAVKLTAHKESRRKLNSGGLELESGSNLLSQLFLFPSKKNSQKMKQVKNSVVFEKVNTVFSFCKCQFKLS